MNITDIISAAYAVHLTSGKIYILGYNKGGHLAACHGPVASTVADNHAAKDLLWTHPDSDKVSWANSQEWDLYRPSRVRA